MKLPWQLMVAYAFAGFGMGGMFGHANVVSMESIVLVSLVGVGVFHIGALSAINREEKSDA